MVTAILPSLTDETGPTAEVTPDSSSAHGRPSIALSVDSESTITPERFRTDSHNNVSDAGVARPRCSDDTGKPSALAGYVGLFTGCGALVALALFLPLPARFGGIDGVTLADALKYSFYVVGTISFLVAVFVFVGLRGLRGEEGKGFRMLLGLKSSTAQSSGPADSDSDTHKTVRSSPLPHTPPPAGTSTNHSLCLEASPLPSPSLPRATPRLHRC